MPELKKNFTRGRMNKDLDERLVPNGEYRDALNIQIATTEGSDIGSAQTLLSNVQLTDWITSGQNAFFTNVPKASNFTESDIMTRSHAKAETIGIFADDNNNKVYNFISEANSTYAETSPSDTFHNENGLTTVPSDGLYSKPNGQGGFIYQDLPREIGVKCDVICEYNFGVDTSVVGSLLPVVVDVFEARHAPRFVTSKTAPGVIDPPMINGSNEIKGLATVTYSDNSGVTRFAPAGIREGMIVQKVRPDGVNLWAQHPDIVVTSVDLTGAKNDGVVVISQLASDQEIYTQQDANEGVVLVFRAPRVLNFKQSVREKEVTYDEYEVETIGSESPTPNGNIITAINLVDDLLFFTDGRNEPKKLNIQRFKNGSKGFLDHTRIIFPNGDQNLGTYIREQHITAIKVNPKKAPKVALLGAREIDNNTANYIDVANNIDFNYSPETTAFVKGVHGNFPNSFITTNLALDNGTVGGELVTGDLLKIKSEVNQVYWQVGDVIELVASGLGGRFKIDSVNYGAVDANGNNDYPTGWEYSVFNIRFLEYIGTYVAPATPDVFLATLVEKGGIYKNEFVKLAMRYKYLDNEYSCISPYSPPLFKSKAYGFNAETGWNPGMESKAEQVVVYDFVSSDLPEDVKEIEILYRNTGGFPAVYSAFKVKPTFSAWNQSYPDFGNLNDLDKGRINITDEIFGNIIPTNQLDRTYDALPKKAKAQEFIASRILYGNYTENYDLIDSSGVEVDGNISINIDSLSFPFTSITFDQISAGNNIFATLDDYNYPRHGVQLLQLGSIPNPSNGAVNFGESNNRPFDNSNSLGWGGTGNNLSPPEWFSDNIYPVESGFSLVDYTLDAAGSLNLDLTTGAIKGSVTGMFNASDLPKLIRIPFTREINDPNGNFDVNTTANPRFHYTAGGTGQHSFDLSAVWKACHTYGYVTCPTMTNQAAQKNERDLTQTYPNASNNGEKLFHPYYVPVFRPAPAAIQLHYVDDNGNPTIPSGKLTSLVQDINGDNVSTDPTDISLHNNTGSITGGTADPSNNGYNSLQAGTNLNTLINSGSSNNIPSFEFYRAVNCYRSHQFINSLNNRIWECWRHGGGGLSNNLENIPQFLNLSGVLGGADPGAFRWLGATEATIDGVIDSDPPDPYNLGNSLANGVRGHVGELIHAGLSVTTWDTPSGNNVLQSSDQFYEVAHQTGGLSPITTDHETSEWWPLSRFIVSPTHWFYDHARGAPYCHASMQPTVQMNAGEKVALFYRAWDFAADGIVNTYNFLDKHPNDIGGLFNQKVLSTGASGIKFYDFDGDGSNDTFRTVNGEPDFQYSCSWEYNQNYYGTPQTQLNNNPAANNVVGVGTPSGVQGFNVLAVDRIIDHATSTADAGFNFSPSFRSVGGSNGWTYLTDEDGNGGVAGASYHLHMIGQLPQGSNTTLFTQFKVTSAPSFTQQIPIKQGTESVKSERSYEVGVVYSDKFGRESTVVIDREGYDSSLFLQKSQCNQKNRILTKIFHNAPAWADNYKFYIKETAPEYYNISMHKAYDNNDSGTYAWLSFNSSDRNKIKEEDFLALKKKHGSNDAVTSQDANWKVLAISNGIPNGADGNPIDAAGSTFDTATGAPTIPIGGQDSGGKFFVKVLADEFFDEFLGDVTIQGNDLQNDNFVVNGAVFEVRPDVKTVITEEENADQFGLFWEMSDGIPIKLDKKNAQQYIKIGSTFELDAANSGAAYTADINAFNNALSGAIVHNVIGASSFSPGLPGYAWSGHSTNTNNANLPLLADEVFCIVDFNGPLPFQSTGGFRLINAFNVPNQDRLFAKFIQSDGSFVTAEVASDIVKVGNRNRLYLKPYTHSTNGYYLPLQIGHDWFNCYAFGNGVESDRIRDDFNEKTVFPYTAIGKQSGFKASKFFDDYKEEYRPSDIIYSQLYNERTGVDQTNQFILADKITKRLNPEYGSITKLHARNDNIVSLCENKIVQILASGKDALFNADGNSQLLASSRVLGQTIPYLAEYGCQHPESFASDEYRIYFVDASKGAALRLSRDGITPISGAGMSTWFYDNLNKDSQYESRGTTKSVVGSFDDNKQEYNITIHNSINPNWKKAVYSLAYHEPTDGWVSFRSYVPEAAFSINNKYFTIKSGEIWGHSEESLARTYNEFYGVDYDSTVTLLFNDAPSSVKSFRTMSYEGTQSKVVANNSDGEYYNATSVDGWYVEDIGTDKQEGNIPEFIDKEGKWFNYIYGEATTHTNAADGGSNLNNLDFAEFSVQGLGNLSSNATVVSGTTPALGFTVTPTLTVPTGTAFTVGSAFSSALQNITATPTQSFISAFEITPSPGYTLNAASFGLSGSTVPTINNSSGTAVSPFNGFQDIVFTNSGTANTPNNTVLVKATLSNAITISSDQTLTIPITGNASSGSLIYETLVVINHTTLSAIPSFNWSPSNFSATISSQNASHTTFILSGVVQPNTQTNLFSLNIGVSGNEFFSSNASVTIDPNSNNPSNYNVNSSLNVYPSSSNIINASYLTSSSDEFLSSGNQIDINLISQPCAIIPSQTYVIVDNTGAPNSNPVI